MKNVIPILLGAFALIFTSCSKKVELTPVNIEPIIVENGNVTYKVDPRIEILMAAYRLAEFNFAMIEGGAGEYLSGIDKILEKQKEHPLVKQLKAATKDYMGDLCYCLNIVNYISPDFTSINLNKKNLPADLEFYWGNVDLEKFIQNLNDFAIQSNYERIFKLYDKTLKSAINNMKEFFNKNDKLLPWIEDYFYAPETEINYVINICPTLNQYMVSLKEINDGNKITHEIFLLPFVQQDGYVDVNYSINWSYKILRELIKENWADLEEPIKKIVNDISEKNQFDIKKYKDYNYSSAVADSMSVLFIENYIKATQNEEIVKDLMESIKSSSYLEDFDTYLEYAHYYEENRNIYPDFEKFFAEYVVKKIKEDL